MYKIRVRSKFSSAHNLREYKGKCEELHGHNWFVEAVLSSDRLDKTGMVMDFGDVKKALGDIIAVLDHKYLNEIEYFKINNPTSENIAKYIYDEMKSRVNGGDISEVSVWETETAAATYMEN